MSNSIEQALSPAQMPINPGRLRALVQAMRGVFQRNKPGVERSPDTQFGMTRFMAEKTAAPAKPASVLSRIKPTHASALSAALASLSLIAAGSLSLYQYQHDSYLLQRSEQARELSSSALLLASELEGTQGVTSESSAAMLQSMQVSLDRLQKSVGDGFLGATRPYAQESVLLGGVTRAWDQVYKAHEEMKSVSAQQQKLADMELRLMVAGNGLVDAASPDARPELRAFVDGVMKAAASGQKQVELTPLSEWVGRNKLSAVAIADFAAVANLYFSTAASIKDVQPVLLKLAASSSQLSNRLQVYAEAVRLEREVDIDEATPVLVAGWSVFLLSACAAVAWVAFWWRSEARRKQAEAMIEAERAEFERQRFARQEDETMDALMVFNDMADGDFTQSFEVTDTSIGTVKASANIMIEHVRGALEMATGSSAALETHFGQIEHVFRFLRKVETNQKQTAERSAELAQQMSQGMTSLLENAALTREAISTVNERSTVGVQAATSTVQSMGSIRSAIQDTNKRMKKLGESIQEIMKIAEVLQRMADQANVLAMNTALQASQANDRRMTVLAEEVGKLSESLGQSMVSIGSMGQEIGADARDTIASMERSVQFVVDGTRQIETVQHTLAEIAEAAQDVAGAEEGVQAVIDAQNRDTANMARFASHSLSLAKHMGDAAGKLDANVVQMRAELSQLKDKLSEFKV